MSDDDGVRYPADPTVDHRYRPVLYRADGQPLRRQIGFAMVQTSSTFPELSKTKRKSGSKKKC